MSRRPLLLVLLAVLLLGVSVAAYLRLRSENPRMAELPAAPAEEGPDPKAKEADALMRKADALAEKLRYDEAIALYRQVMERFPDTEDPLNDFGDARFSTAARQEIAYLECRKRAPKDPFFDTPEAMLQAIRAAAQSGDGAKLASLAACEFAVGLPQSDIFEGVDPARIGQAMADLLRTAKWAEAKIDLPSRSIRVWTRETEFWFTLLEAELGRHWRWTALSTQDENALTRLAEAAGVRQSQ